MFDLISLYNSSDIIFDNCQITDNKTILDDWANYALFNVDKCSNVVIKNSKVEGNTAKYFLNEKNSVKIENTSINDNTFTVGAYMKD